MLLRRYLADLANEEVHCDLRYPGQLYDAESGLYYNRHRYYDPEAGQYISPDPIGLMGGLRPQGYVHNPLEWVDPLGLAKAGCIGTPKDAQKKVNKGQGPKEIKRIDEPEQSVPGSQWHAHQTKSEKGKHPALNLDGSTHDGPPSFSKKTTKWLKDQGGTWMINCDKEMQKLIKKEGLNNPSIFFSECDAFEEIPLFSRWKNISFLSSFSFNEKNKFLIKKCLELISHSNSCSLSYMSDVSDYFICLSLTNWDDYSQINCLTPNIFFSRRKEWLLSKLRLAEKQTIEENIIREYLFSLGVFDCKVLISDGFEKNKRVYVISDSIL